jgi:hypothetical protein
VESLFDGSPAGIGQLAGAYFSGLTPHMAEVRELKVEQQPVCFDEDLPWYAYWAIRLLCAHRQWRVVATVFAKCQYGMLLVAGVPEML